MRVYERDPTNSIGWTQLGVDIDGEAAVNWSGYSVSLSSDGLTVAIGALYNDSNGDRSGHVRVYKCNRLTFPDVLVNNDLNIASHDGTNGLKLGGTLVTATAAELNTYILNVALDDISTSSSCYVVAPKAGTISKISSIINGSITGNAVITANVHGGSDIPETLTISDGSNAGTIHSCTPGSNNTVTAGQYISLTTNGFSTGTVKAEFTIEITY